MPVHVDLVDDEGWAVHQQRPAWSPLALGVPYLQSPAADILGERAVFVSDRRFPRKRVLQVRLCVGDAIHCAQYLLATG